MQLSAAESQSYRGWFAELPLVRWFLDNPAVTYSIGVASIVLFVLSLFIIRQLIIRMPADYYHRKPAEYRHGHAMRWLLFACKNLLGAALVLLGLIMFITPGQGVLTLLLGISLMNFPGKHELEVRLIRIQTVTRAINSIRRRAGKPALDLPPKAAPR